MSIRFPKQLCVCASDVTCLVCSVGSVRAEPALEPDASISASAAGIASGAPSVPNKTHQTTLFLPLLHRRLITGTLTAKPGRLGPLPGNAPISFRSILCHWMWFVAIRVWRNQRVNNPIWALSDGCACSSHLQRGVLRGRSSGCVCSV